MKLPAILLLIGFGLLGCVEAAPEVAASGAGPSPTEEPATSSESPAGAGLADCFWAARSDPVLVNVLYPDQDAIYYIAAVPVLPGRRLELVGAFPHSRYMSFVSYDGLPVDALLDRDIPAEVGSTNPFVVGANRNASARGYRVRLLGESPPADAAHRQPGSLYLGPGQVAAPLPVVYLFYRLYVTDRGQDAAGGVDLPRLEIDGQPVPQGFEALSCERLREAAPALSGVQQGYAEVGDVPSLPYATRTATDPPGWSVESGLTAGGLSGTPAAGAVSGGPGSNPHNRYLSAVVSRAHGELLVVRGRAPSTPPTRNAEPVMADGQLRYWSFCQNSQSTRYLACLSDSDMVLDADGRYRLVISAPEFRPEAARNWLPFGPEPEGRLLFRHMLPKAEFLPNSAQGYQPEGPPLAEQMGEYFPDAIYCARADFDAGRCGE